MAALLLNPNVSFCRLFLFLLRMRSCAAFSCFLISRSRDIFCSVSVLLSSTIAKRSSAYMSKGEKLKTVRMVFVKMVWSSCQFQSRQQAGWFISIHIRWKRDFKLSQTKAPYLTNKQITTIMITENLREYSLKILTFEISLGLDKKQEQWIFPYNVAILFFQPPLPLPCSPPPPSPQWKKPMGSLRIIEVDNNKFIIIISFWPF